jgi:hypothetical protein
MFRGGHYMARPNNGPRVGPRVVSHMQEQHDDEFGNSVRNLGNNL